MKFLVAIVGLAIAGLAVFLTLDYFRPGDLIDNSASRNNAENLKSMAERVAKAEEKSQGIKGVYMTSNIANDSGPYATKLRDQIIGLLDETELNGAVIDVKETDGGLIITDRLRDLINVLHQKKAWVIARQVVFKDSSQEKNHPDWYLKKMNGAFWRDNRGGSWLNPNSKEAWRYQLVAAKAASDAGFDEIQFDYIRFPSDGNTRDIVYPSYDAKRPKYEVLLEFFGYMHDELKRYRPDLILSADFFGYVAMEKSDIGIGQRLEDIGENFDYVSPMVYPSHYYSGFQIKADSGRNLPAVYYPYRSQNISQTAVNQPYDVVYRTLLMAGDILAGKVASATDQGGESARRSSGLSKNDKTATLSSVSPPRSSRPALLRPWLQDFDLAVDSARGVRYDAPKIRAQIDAAQAAGSSGWLLWSPDNVYTKEALKLNLQNE